MLGSLHAVVAGLRGSGPGRLVLVPGEAGAGKTSVVRAFLAELPSDVVALVGGCDNLRTARPLGPLLDWARADRAMAPPDGLDREAIFDHVLAGLSRSPTVAVVEDLHWADEATLDLVGFLARRLDGARSALVLTYRTDEAAGHPLGLLLGELARLRPVRLPMAALSAKGVAALARDRGIDPVELHARTGGNAFFVSECLASATERVPSTARDAVRTRIDGLPTDLRRAVEAVSVVPGGVELWLATAMGLDGPTLDACVGSGVLVADTASVGFRHEIEREVVHDQLLPAHRQALHRRALGALRRPPEGSLDHARCTHHAVEAGDGLRVREHAPRAAAAALAAGARREAVAHLELALAHGPRLDPADRLDLWSQLADERSILGRHEASIEAYATAIVLADEQGDHERRGGLLARQWTPLSMAGDLEGAERVASEAIAVLESCPPGPGLALAYAQRCSQHMLARELAVARPWGRRAIELADHHGDAEVLAYALIQSGVAGWMAGHEEGLEELRRGVAVARDRRLHRLVAQGLSQIGSGGGEVRRYAEAVPALEECVAFAERHELVGRGLYASAWLARCQVDLGRWDDASAALAAVLRSPRCEGITRLVALTEVGRLRARRGDPDVWAPLDEALDLAEPTGHLQRLWPVVAARAEAAWLEDRLDDEVAALDRVHALALALEHPWAIGELGWWLQRAGAPDVGPTGEAPYALLRAGRPAAAADAWDALGCSYDAAVARSEAEGDAEQLRALRTFQSLGAARQAERLVARRRAEGRRVPRGPNGSTRRNPAGLSGREVEVLRLVAAGHTNPEIAGVLHISTKTAAHHVSHLLAKLGARTRTAAVAAALDAGVELHG